MALTRAQRGLQREAEVISEITKTNFASVGEKDADMRIPLLKIAINHMVVGEVVNWYTLLDEMMSDVICKYFFKVPNKQFHFGRLWRTKKFRTFVHYMLDEMYLLKKMELVHAIKPLPGQVRSTVYKVNSVRNAVAHSFFPENRKEYRKLGKVMYGGRNLRTSEGLELFRQEASSAFNYIARRMHPGWQDIEDMKE
jgi:hypothetical protein